MDKKTFYISTAIAYVNGAPHFGHALEFIQADVVARFKRMRGFDTYFLTGTDEHGLKIYEKAEEKGLPVQEFVDQNAKLFEDLEERLNLSNDNFVRTSSGMHERGAQKIWMKMFDKGDIYKGNYEGNYCVGCESFIPDKDLDEEGSCLIHKVKPRQLKEENYFFKLSKYSDAIKKMVESNELKIVPESRKKEMLNLIGDEGLRDVSFSRPADVLPWGVKVPNDDSQVMYVWCDALSNYITALGYEQESEIFQKFWPADVHLIGKDILRFHAGIWIGMLLSADMEIPKSIYVHGFVTTEGEKMSKSLGNVIDPLDYVKEFSIDALRYYLIREIPSTDDGDFSRAKFIEVYNSELANGLGNLVNRVLMMVERYLDGVVPDFDGVSELETLAKSATEKYLEGFENFDLRSAMEEVLRFIDVSNKFIDEEKPWMMAKEGSDKLAGVLYELLETLRVIAEMLYPVIPETSLRIAEFLGLRDGEFGKFGLEWGIMKSGSKVKAGGPLFPRFEEK